MAKARALSAIELLEEDHEYVRKSYRAFQKMDQEDLPAVQALVKQVCAALKVHTRIEDIRQLERMKPSDPKYAAAFTVVTSAPGGAVRPHPPRG